ncbi:MAG TPA: ATP-binding protein, partial [Rhodoblastus sp.]|nr:ATP-binding protein [Rhodoblastus sp.]
MPQSPNANASQTAILDKIAAVKASLPAASPPDRDGEPAALRRLRETFGLSAFESDALMLCAAMELDGETASLLARAQGDAARPYPTFSLLLALLPGAHWSATAPDAPLRYWRLIEIGDGPVLTQAPLRIDERVLHYLAGAGRFDLRLATFLTPAPPMAVEDLAPSHAVIARRIARLWDGLERGPELTIAQLRGPASDCRAIAAAAARHLGLSARRLAAERLPQGAAEIDQFLRLWDRECALSGAGLLMVDVEPAGAEEAEAARTRAAIGALIERVNGPTILREREPRRIEGRPAVAFDVAHPTRAEQMETWQANLGEAAPPERELTATVAQFSLSPATIRDIAREARAQAEDSPPGRTDLWDACRRRMRGGLDGLAERVDSRQHWDDLILPKAQKDTLRALAAQMRQRGKVLDDWGFAEKSRRGQGLSALFYGPSGTGKTMAAEVLATEFRLDLYHIDLSRVVSKYIGETEANLRRVFDAAEDNGAILLFDEADSLFGKRSEVKDSHDRYANIEVSYLLQRMEAYRGLAILTTNMRDSLDPAFLRRIRFAMSFPFPDAPQRAAIWRQIFPAAAKTEDLHPEKLALLRIAGGNIRNIALNAAFLAADEDEP